MLSCAMRGYSVDCLAQPSITLAVRVGLFMFWDLIPLLKMCLFVGLVGSVELWVEPRPSHLISKRFTTELQPQP